jgi:hypothetical protein
MAKRHDEFFKDKGFQASLRPGLDFKAGNRLGNARPGETLHTRQVELHGYLNTGTPEANLRGANEFGSPRLSRVGR